MLDVAVPWLANLKPHGLDVGSVSLALRGLKIDEGLVGTVGGGHGAVQQAANVRVPEHTLL